MMLENKLVIEATVPDYNNKNEICSGCSSSGTYLVGLYAGDVGLYAGEVGE
jgi:hypothetical protein